jgi:hypothetical protein
VLRHPRRDRLAGARHRADMRGHVVSGAAPSRPAVAPRAVRR